MSVLPYRIESSIVSSLIQPIRYWWELALPRRFFAKPPVLSTCWLINRKSLEKLGGFEAIKRSIIPERFFARELIKSDEYSFLRSSGKMDIKTVKKVSSSKETVTRIRYPQLDRRPEYVYLLGVFEILFLVGPVILVCNLAVVSANLLVLFPLAAAVFLAISHMLIIQSTNPTKTIFSIFTYPLIILSDLIFTNVSMYKYEFATVDWKGRNVCTPVMRVYSKLPNISSKHRHKKR